MLKLLAVLFFFDYSCDAQLNSYFTLFFCLSNQENIPLPARHSVWVCSCLHLRKHFSVLLSGHFDLKIM